MRPKYGTLYLFTSANPKHTLPSDVILRCITFVQPILPPSGPCNAPWFFPEILALYKSLSYLLCSVSSSHYTSEQTFNTLDTAQHSTRLAICTPQTETLALTRGQHWCRADKLQLWVMNENSKSDVEQSSTVWVKKKSPPRVFWKFFPNGWEFLINFLHTYYAIIYTLDYKILFKYLQPWQSYAIPSATT